MIPIYDIASTIGTITFALSGVSVGVRKGMDVLGIFILAFLTANGGGVVRDVLIGQTPGVLTDLNTVGLVAFTFLVGCVLHRLNWANIEERRLFLLTDALGLVAFSLTGALLGVEHHLSVFGVIVLSFLTATGGGIIRDVLCNEVPLILSSDFYGSVAILVAVLIYGLYITNHQTPSYILGVFSAALLLRILAFQYHWRLPKIKFSS